MSVAVLLVLWSFKYSCQCSTVSAAYLQHRGLFVLLSFKKESKFLQSCSINMQQ